MYGVVEAGDDGWGSSSAIVPVVAGLVVLAVFVLWERRLTAQPGGQPLIDLSLFRSRSFTWGVLLTAFGVFGLFGVLFGLPQYFQAIMGVDPQGSGFRLLPAVVGLLVGAVTADRVTARIGAKLTVAIGFAVVVVGSLVGATMTATSGDGFIAGWTFIVGLGGGVGFATAASAALVELSADRSGVGAALLQAVVKLGPAFGASFLGSVLNSTYQAQVAVDRAARGGCRRREGERLRRARGRAADRVGGAARLGQDGIRGRHGRRRADHRGRGRRRDRASPSCSCPPGRGQRGRPGRRRPATGQMQAS